MATASLQVVVERNKVIPELLFLYAEQPLLPQLLLIGLQTLHQICYPSVDTLQHPNIFLRVKKWVLHKTRISGQNCIHNEKPYF